MATVFVVAFYRILKPKSVLLYELLNSGVAAAATLFSDNLFSSPILQGQIISFTSYFAKLSFLWVLGFPLMIWIALHGEGLIAEEKKDTTLLVLASKPITRPAIFGGKILALFLSSLLIGICSIFTAIAVLTLIVSPDPMIILQLLHTIPVLLIYLIFICTIFSALSLGVSFLSRNRGTGFLGISAFAAAVFFILPLCGQLSSIFVFFLSMADGYLRSPAIHTDLIEWLSDWIPHYYQTLARFNAWEVVLRLNPLIVLGIWLAVSLSVLGLAIRKFMNMDISEYRG